MSEHCQKLYINSPNTIEQTRARQSSGPLPGHMYIYTVLELIHRLCENRLEADQNAEQKVTKPREVP
jgi:hypothetical protein